MRRKIAKSVFKLVDSLGLFHNCFGKVRESLGNLCELLSLLSEFSVETEVPRPVSLFLAKWFDPSGDDCS